MNIPNHFFAWILCGLLVGSLQACGSESLNAESAEETEEATTSEADETTTGNSETDEGSTDASTDATTGDIESWRPDGWGTESHAKGADAQYERIFPDSEVQRLDIIIGADTYADMQENMTDLYGASNSGGGGGPGGGGPGGMASEEPSFFPVTVQYDQLTWWHVGMRYKGNSTLRSAWQRGVKKIPFRLDFDEFEETYEEIDDQRFYGFKKLTFSNGYKDDSLIREKLGAEIFRDAGVKAARGAFYRIYFDIGDGNGPTYAGLYTMVEDLSNKFLDSQFDDDSGNLYKPDGTAASWTHFSEDNFIKKTNEEEGDWSDIETAIEALHADRSDAEAWRTELEHHFNANAYLKLLAVNQTIQNWDTYGSMTHNYYLYGDPDDNGRLSWIPWDLNECMLASRGGPGGSGGFSGGSILLDEVGDNWPVIRYLLDDPVYAARYYEELAALLDGAFAIEKVHTRMQELHDLISPWVVGEHGESSPYTSLANSEAFVNSLTSGDNALIPHVESRHSVVEEALRSVGSN